jgi:multidrug efflux pump subunit AcrA (membrane-fusion protein)
MLKSKKTIIIVAVALIAVVVGGIIWTNKSNKKTPQRIASVQTTRATRSSLTVYASASGKITPELTYNMGFEKKGTLIELNVSVGDQVKKGQLLARLQTESTQAEIDANIAAAELEVAKAQQALDDLIASAETDKAAVMQNIVTYAEEVKDARYQLELYLVPQDQIKLSAIDAFDMTRKRLEEASAAFEPYKYLSQYFDKREEMLEKLYQAQADYNAAVTRLQYEYQLEVAQANLNKARADYEKLKDGPDPAQLAIAKADLASAEAKLALAKENKSILEMTAPIDGNIVEVSAKVGEVLDAAPVITLVSRTCPQLEIYLDENDLGKIKIGYETEIVFDALPNKKYFGKVIQIDPSLVDLSGVSSVRAVVALDEKSCSQADQLVIGLNASVEVIAGRVNEAVIVPIEALREIDADEYGVFVMENGKIRLRKVTVGLMDETTAEIREGLEAGEVVTTGTIKKN